MKHTIEEWRDVDVSMLRDANVRILLADALRDIFDMHDKILYLEELREGDFKLTRALAEGMEIEITASDKLPGAQWEEFHDGCMALLKQNDETDRKIAVLNGE